MTTQKSRRNSQQPRLPLWLLGIVVILVLIVIIGGGIWLFQTVQAMASAWEVSQPEFGEVSELQPINPDEADPVVSQVEPLQEPANDGPPTVSLQPWQGTERLNFLLLGVDQRCDEEGPTHTDTLILLTVDPVVRSASMLSLPRDLWIEVPGFGVDRINQAYYYGELNEYPGGGPALAIETVEATLGVEIDYFAAINFDAFTESVDLIGGITVDVPETIDDTNYPDRCYGYDPFFIEEGLRDLNGENALKYARTRATFGGDVDRAARQQQVLVAVQNKLTQPGTLPQLIRQAPQLWRSYQENVRTNVTLDEALQFALLMQEIPAENIQTAVIDYNYVYNETTPDGRQVLVPIRDEIRTLRDELFAPPPIPTPTFEDLPQLMLEEGASVGIYNGTAVFGLAASTQEYLRRFGFTITEIGNADSAAYQTTQIIDFGDYPQTAQYLVQLMDIPPLNISTSLQEPEGNFDLLIILGDDWRVPGSE